MFGTQFKEEVFIPLPLLYVCMCLCVCMCGICTVIVVVFRHTGGIYGADLIFEEEMIFWEDTGLPHFYIAVWDTMDESKVTIEMDLHGSPCPPDLTALDFYFLIHKECSLHATISHHFARPCWDDTTCYHYSYTHYT